MLLPLLFFAAAQVTPSKLVTPTPKLPPANPIAYADPDAANVMTPVNALLAGIAARDSQAILAQTRPDGHVTVAEEAAGGARTVRTISWSAFAATIQPGSARLEERLTDPAIEVDGDLAMVWSPYVFLIDGKPHHCGTDQFTLIRQDGAWRVQDVAYTQRSTGCPGQ